MLDFLRNINVSALVVCLTLPQLVGIVSAGLTRDNMKIIQQIVKQPWFTPPAIVFPIVWPTLYFMMGVASYRVYTSTDNFTSLTSIPNSGNLVNNALFMYGIQLCFNFLWSIFYFGLGQILMALIDGALLSFTIFLTMREFYTLDKPAGLMMIPYLAWSLFALFLTINLYWLNGASVDLSNPTKQS